MEVKKAYKSFHYKNDVVWKAGRRGMISALGKPHLEVGSPPEFKGEPGIWTPEDMLVGALNTCLMLTFLALAASKGVDMGSYESSAEGLLENVEGKYRITEVTVQPSVGVRSQADLEAAQKIMQSVEANCFISNSITAKVKLAPQFRVEPDAA
jgi:organic hydroperoxide reductase OsmC/OhrA